MELISSKISKTWKLFFVGSLLGCMVLVLYLNQNGISVSFSASKVNIMQQLLPLYTKSSTFVKPMVAQPPQHGQPQAPPMLNPPVQEASISSTTANPPVQQFISQGQSKAPMLSMMAKPPVQQFISPYGQSKAPKLSIMAKPPIQQFIPYGQSKVPMLSMMANPPVQETFLHGQLEKTTSSMTAKPPVQDGPSHDEPSHVTVNLTLTSTSEKKELIKSTQITHVEKVAKNSTKVKCNIFDGRWVYKAEDKPSYDSNTCPFVEEKMSCQKNGRPDNDYEKWRWEPKHCDIPLFNGREMLKRLRSKRVIIVGDSLNRNMWESLACLLYSSIHSSRVEVQARKAEYKILKAKDYNAVIEFYWSPFLVEYDTNHKSGKRILVLDRLSANSKQWRGADIMVFNSANWWIQSGKFKKWDLIQYKGQLFAEGISIEQAYEIGLKLWAQWLKNNVYFKKTIVFFRSVSPSHKGVQFCFDVKKPINNDSSYKNNFPKSLINISKNVIRAMKMPTILYLDITKLSEYRMDAHPSVFRSSQGIFYATKSKNSIWTFSDCSHWCLPGLPDTWNRLFYTMLYFNNSWNMSNF